MVRQFWGEWKRYCRKIRLYNTYRCIWIWRKVYFYWKPYENFLTIIGKHLNENGKIIIAIENKLGLKYWAGCQEDHVGKYFEGIEDYPITNGVKTFSKKN